MQRGRVCRLVSEKSVFWDSNTDAKQMEEL
jgi:hypothetical protein